MTKQRLGLRVAGTIFALFALVHVYRLVAQVQIRIGTQLIPMWPSVIGMIVGAALAIWLWKLSGQKSDS